MFALILSVPSMYAQSGHSSRSTNVEGSILSVVVKRTDGKKDQVKASDLFLYENALEQKILNFSYDPSPSRILILVDNSQTIPIEIADMKEAIMDFAYEIFDGDQIYVIAYDEKPEIIQEWTDDADSLSKSLETLRKQGNPRLFDAMETSIEEVLAPLMPGTRKTAVVVIGDGLDRGSGSSYEKMISHLQNLNISVYALSVRDRTGGAYRRNSPKPAEVIKGLTTDTGGASFDFADAKTAAKTICDELRQNRYLLTYNPTNTSSYDARRLFIVPEKGIELRYKSHQPPNIK
ncbi:MAG: VWA domain-containing protein [Pyrinomonadaceae bacterium]